MREVELISHHSVKFDTIQCQGCCSSPILVASPWPWLPPFLRATVKHVANAMQCTKGFMLERALVGEEKGLKM